MDTKHSLQAASWIDWSNCSKKKEDTIGLNLSLSTSNAHNSIDWIPSKHDLSIRIDSVRCRKPWRQLMLKNSSLSSLGSGWCLQSSLADNMFKLFLCVLLNYIQIYNFEDLISTEGRKLFIKLYIGKQHQQKIKCKTLAAAWCRLSLEILRKACFFN